MMDEMMDERRIDEAIESYPIAPLPTGFTQRVMAQVIHTPQFDVKFRLQFIDLVLPAFITAFGTAVTFTALWLSGYWTIEGLPEPALSTTFANYFDMIPSGWLGFGMLFLLAEIVVSLLIAAQVISDSPRVALQNGR